MYILVTSSTLMEEMFVEEILTGDIFMISQNCKILHIFSDGNQSQKQILQNFSKMV